MVTKNTTKKDNRPVLVLDTHRGIYFGYLIATTNAGRTVKLERARHCFYFSVAEAGHKGVYGLATIGPAPSSKIGPRVTMEVHDVAKIVDCEQPAVDRWESSQW